MLDNYLKYLKPGSLTIYLFHGVIEKQEHQLRNYTRKHILKDEFDDLMGKLNQNGHALSMYDVADHVNRKIPFPDNSFAITFDDGFENNLSVAAPVLLAHKIPAMFYVTSEYISTNTMSWTDRVELGLEDVPEGRLKFSWSDESFEFKNLKDKIAIMEYLRGYVKYHQEIDFEEMVSDIFRQLGKPVVSQSQDPLDLKMNWDQVFELSQIPGLSVGGHSHKHVILSFLNDQELEDDITTSLYWLKKGLKSDVDHYSYPEGLAHCYDERVIRILKQKEIICCPSAIEGINTHNDDLFHLKRIFVV